MLRHPGAFTLQALKGFRANQGLLLAGAVAYYALLSIVPLLILIVIALSHVIDQAELLETLDRYLGWLVPGQSEPIVAELENFLAHRDVIGIVLFATMLFFSSLAFTVLENAMSIIFVHRVGACGRAAAVRRAGPLRVRAPRKARPRRAAETFAHRLGITDLPERKSPSLDSLSDFQEEATREHRKQR